MVDIDHFKQINDNFGHPFGHKVLAEVANRMLSEVRSYEAVGRYGGEEFLIVLSGCDPLGANKQAERVRNRVGEKKISVQGVKVEITVSMGIASSCHVEQPAQELLIRMADAAVYRAKRAGRNRVELASGEQEQFSTPAEDPDAFDLSTDSSPRKGEGEWAEEETRAGLTQLSPPAELV
jgi:diguanylate cyclase (GGDEF)-like protein